MNPIRFSSIHYLNKTLLKPDQQKVILDHVRNTDSEVLEDGQDVLILRSPALHEHNLDLALTGLLPSYYAENLGIPQTRLPAIATGIGLNGGVRGKGVSDVDINRVLDTLESLGVNQPEKKSMFLIPGLHCMVGSNEFSEAIHHIYTRLLKDVPSVGNSNNANPFTPSETSPSAFGRTAEYDNEELRRLLDMPNIDSLLGKLGEDKEN